MAQMSLEAYQVTLRQRDHPVEVGMGESLTLQRIWMIQILR